MDLNTKNGRGQTLLLVAAKKGRVAVVRLLITRCDVDINAKDVGGWTPLSVAAAVGHGAVVRLLVRRKKCLILMLRITVGGQPSQWKLRRSIRKLCDC